MDKTFDPTPHLDTDAAILTFYATMLEDTRPEVVQEGRRLVLEALARLVAAKDPGMVRYTTEFMMPSLTYMGSGRIEVEDGGASLIYEPPWPPGSDPDKGFFVRLQSWDDTPVSKDLPKREQVTRHGFFRRFLGRKVRVSVETLPD